MRMPAIVIALATTLTACGGAKAPQTAQEAAELTLKALAEGKIDSLKSALASKADYQEALKKSGEKDKGNEPGEIEKEVAELEGRVGKALGEATGTAKDGGFDLAKAKVASVEAKEDKEGELVDVRIEARLESGDKKANLEVRALKLDRGLVIVRPPELELDGLCERALANVINVTTGVDDPMAKALHDEFGKPETLRSCKDELGKPGSGKAQIECLAGAKDWAAIQACMNVK